MSIDTFNQLSALKPNESLLQFASMLDRIALMRISSVYNTPIPRPRPIKNDYEYTFDSKCANVPVKPSYPPIPPGFKINHCPTHVNSEKIEWEHRETCYMSHNKQCGTVWKLLRNGRIPASRVCAVSKRSIFEEDQIPENIGMELCGLSQKSFNENSKALMQEGVIGEPIVKKWLSDDLKVKIYDVGVAIWKEDVRFCASLDGEIDKDFFCEVKIPGKGIYRSLIEHMEALKKGFTPPPGSHRHIYKSHYDQITQSGIITNKKACIYVIGDLKRKQYYTEIIPINREHWNKILYPQSVEFYSKYMEPMMVRNSLKRIDPYIIEDRTETS
jgi:hypothetical protein